VHGLPLPVLDVCYEDLQANPQRELSRALQFLDVDAKAAPALTSTYSKLSPHLGSRCSARFVLVSFANSVLPCVVCRLEPESWQRLCNEVQTAHGGAFAHYLPKVLLALLAHAN
jgi:hypothetical protein